MRKIILSLVAAIACHTILFAQGVEFTEAPLKKVLEKAKEIGRASCRERV